MIRDSIYLIHQKYLYVSIIMKASELLKNLAYAVIFGFFGIIIGIWTADLLYSLVLKGMEQAATRNISVVIIVLIVLAASFLGFTKGKSLLESS